ncbi:43kDa postsynaptic protein [Parasponia andersonii]|uniref:RING-type E3 ubiquitin transferase n=1 Tax=Parasponia andersonii TaxID=3476 RepID=A0A2P5DHJ0_PARAD|nr:43kDa postsynaptic protein [Parasponia andersonii]
MPRTTTPSPCPTSTTPCHLEYPCHDPEAAKDINIMIIVVAIICAFLCALGLNSMLQCVVQCANRALTEPVEWMASRRLNSGLKKKEMVALPTSTFVDSGSPSSAPGCAICLVDFSEGDKIRVLPKCNHRFHIACIDKWLLSHSSCPTCRNRLKSSDYITCPSL